MRTSIEDHILKQDAKLKDLKLNLETLKELENSRSILLENEYEMCDFKIPLFLEDEYDSQIVTTPLYSFAKSVKVMEDARKWGIVSAINYYLDIELKNGKQRIYCRPENWGESEKRIALLKTTEVKDSHGYGYINEYTRHGPSVEELKSFYTTQGVKKELVEEMERLVNDLRTKNPIRTSWVG